MVNLPGTAPQIFAFSVRDEAVARQLLDAAVLEQDIEWHWVKGHSGHEGNEYVDQLANVAIDRLLAAR